MSEGRCATCKHWQPFDPDEGVPGFGGKNRGVVRANQLGLCRKVSEEADRRREYLDEDETQVAADGTVAMAIDASDYCHELRTAATFGCVLWETKEIKTT